MTVPSIVRPPGIYSYLLNALSLFDIDSSSAVCPFHFLCAQIHGHVDLSFSGASFARVGDTAAGGPDTGVLSVWSLPY